jgi:RNA polymerase sigma-70 factor (ECF subfamily)
MSTQVAIEGASMAAEAPDEQDGGGDRALWRRLRYADQQAFTELFDRYSDAVYNFAFRRTASWSVAEDVVQATFMSLWRRARAGAVDELQLDSARPALLVMAGNECRTALRSARRRDRLVGRIELLPAVGPDHAGLAAGRVDDERAMSEIRRALERIPAKQRKAVELVVWAGCSCAEAAAVLGVPVGTIKSRLFQARTSLSGLVDIDFTQER